MNRTAIVAVVLGALAAPQLEAAPLYRLQTIGHLAGDFASGQAVNNQGQVVGYAGASATSSLPRDAVVWQDGTLSSIGTLGGTRSTALGINDNGVVVGWARDATEASYGMVYAGGTMRALDSIAAAPGWTLGYGWDINTAGQVTGVGTGPDGDRGYVLSLADGTLTDLGTLGGNRSDAYGINEAGDVVGRARTTSGETHAFLYRNGTMSDLGTLGGNASQAWDINDLGVVAGWSTDASGARLAFVHDGSAMMALASLGGGFDQAYDINNRNEVIGQSRDAAGQSKAVLWSEGQVFDLNTLVVNGEGWTLDFAWGINDRGWIVGNARADDGTLHGFVLTPVPEPASVALLLVALAGLTMAGTARRGVAAAA